MFIVLVSCVSPHPPVGQPPATEALFAAQLRLPRVRLNEVMADNASAVSFGGTRPDWIEIVNLDDAPVERSRLSLSDDSGARWQPSASGWLLPGETMLVVADDGETPDGAPFAVSHQRDTVQLWVDKVTVDAVTVEDLGEDLSLARHPDGGPWSPTVHFTPGRSNPVEPSPSLDPSSVFFEPFTVVELALQVDDKFLVALDVKDGPGIPGTLTYDGVTLSVIIKLKGSGSYRGLDSKPSFKVDINRMVEGQRLRGLEALTLNNGAHDATFTHEWLAYNLFAEAGIPSPRVGYARVTLNGVDYGLHTNVETWDDRLLARHYSDPSGLLLEGSRFGDLGDDYSALTVDEGAWDEAFFADLHRVLQDPQATDAAAAFAELVDVEQFVRYAAVEAVSMHWDGYQKPKNYHVYRDVDSGRLQWLPHGTDWTFMRDLPLDYGAGDVFTFCLALPDCADSYYRAVADVAALALDLDLPATFDTLWAWLEPLLEDDPRDLHPPEIRQREHDQTRGRLESRPAWALAEAMAVQR